MNNGCVCCTVRGDLIRLLTKLLSRPERLDAIIIETTGMADPAPVAQTFFVSDEISARARLDGILTVADCYHLVQHLDEQKPEGAENEAVEQILFADKILLNKIDLVSAAQVEVVTRRIRVLNPSAEIIECEYSNAPLASILGIRAFDLRRILDSVDPEFLLDSEHVHDESITSVGIIRTGELNLVRLNDWFSTLLREEGVNIYRMKGILAVADLSEKYVFQGVHMMFKGEPLLPWAKGEPRENRLVFIGRNLNRKSLEAGFAACLN